jgi:hypothetical protein
MLCADSNTSFADDTSRRFAEGQIKPAPSLLVVSLDGGVKMANILTPSTRPLNNVEGRCTKLNGHHSWVFNRGGQSTLESGIREFSVTFAVFWNNNSLDQGGV